MIVVLLAGFALWRLMPAQPDLPVDITPTEEPGGTTSLPSLEGGGGKSLAIIRRVALDTAIEESVRYVVVEYTVERGDTVSSIAASYGIESSTLMWANEELMLNGPNSLRVGQVLLVPPLDGVFYQWEDGDSLEAVADQFEVSSDDILLWPGNEIDLADPFEQLLSVRIKVPDDPPAHFPSGQLLDFPEIHSPACIKIKVRPDKADNVVVQDTDGLPKDTAPR